MAPLPYPVARQVEPGDKAAVTFLPPLALRLLAENILLLLNSVAILFYCYYSLVAHLSIKLRGLAQDGM